MATEFYCEEFPTEQNSRQVQMLKDLLEACPEDCFHFMTPFGYVDLTAQDAEQLRQGAAAQAHTGERGWEIPIPAEKLLQQELVSARKAKNGQWHAITTDPQPKMSESEQMQEMQLCPPALPAPSRPCRRFVRLSQPSRARTRQTPENRTLRLRAGALEKRWHRASAAT